MGARATVMLTTAPAGSGKSYRRCGHFLLTELIPNTSLIHLSNFPVKFDPWGENGEKAGLIAVAAKRGFSEDVIRDRVRVLPEEIVEEWRDGISGPWDYFRELDISGYHLAIDEIHNFCGANSHERVKKQWQEWLGEIRHRGAKIEFISQHPQKIARELKNEAEVRLSLVRGDNRRDPFTGISVGDWGQLWAKVVGKYTPTIFEIEKRMVDEKWKTSREVRFKFQKEFFEVYDSFSAPVQGGGGGQTEKEPFERFTWPRLLMWFVEQNFMALSWRIPLVGFLFWAFALGGLEGVASDVWQKAGASGGLSAPAVVDSSRPADSLTQAMAANPGALSVTAAPVPTAPPPVGQGGAVEKVDYALVETMAAAWKLAAVSSQSVHFANGEWWNVSEAITDGPFAGEVVQEIDMVRRSAMVGSEWVRVGRLSPRVRKWAIAEVRATASEFRTTVQPSGQRPFQKSPRGPE